MELFKALDGSAPLGTFIPAEQFTNHSDLSFSLEVNGGLRQEGNTSDLIFSFAEIIEYVSRFYTLKTGDLIFTGTPSGVGPVKKGDHLVARLAGETVLDFDVRYNCRKGQELHFPVSNFRRTGQELHYPGQFLLPAGDELNSVSQFISPAKTRPATSKVSNFRRPGRHPVF